MASRAIRVLLLVLCSGFLFVVPSSAALEILDATYRPDRTLPEFRIFWKDWYEWGDTPVNYLASGALAVYVRNTGGGSVTISDMLINGSSLASGMGCKEDKLYKCEMMACSVYYPSVKQVLVDAGEPVWWRADPTTIPPGGTGEIFARMRTRVLTTLSCTVVSSAGNVPASITVTNNAVPRVAGYALSPDSTKLHLYLRHPTKGKLPIQILVDGVDKASSSTMGGDANYDLVPVVVNLGTALTRGTYHCFQAVYDDGTKASDGSRVYYDDWKYCVWGGPSLGTTEEEHQWFHNLERHSVNLQKGGQGSWYRSGDGRSHLAAAGFKFLHEDTSTPDLYSIFLCDEIDSGDSNVPTSIVPATIGALSHSMAVYSDSFKANYPQYPTLVNLAANYKPYNHYIYGHTTDILSVDPYYQTRIVDAYWDKPNTKALYSKATYIYAVASSCQAACEPHRLHVILNSCRKHQNDEEAHRVFRWATPEEKRIEVYYAIAAGAKEIAYWWMTPVGVSQDAFSGIGYATEPGSAALWREMGLLGAEAGIAGPVIVNSCPVNVAITKPGKLWVRTLLSDVNTLVLMCVNDDYASTDVGTIMRSLDDVEVGLDLPSWISSPTHVFEVDYKGVRDVSYGVASGRINLHLGQVDVTRMIIITKDSALKSALQSRYTNTYGPRIAQIIPL